MAVSCRRSGWPFSAYSGPISEIFPFSQNLRLRVSWIFDFWFRGVAFQTLMLELVILPIGGTCSGFWGSMTREYSGRRSGVNRRRTFLGVCATN